MSQHNSQITPPAPLADSSPCTSDNRSPRRWVPILFLMYGLMFWCAPSFAQPTMDIQRSLDAYKLVDSWVRDWEIPGKDDPASTGPIATIAIVTLRIDGQVLGRGTSVSLDPSSAVVWEAASRAMRRVDAKLTQDRDALWDEFIANLARRITITIEIADTLVPISDSEIDLPGFGYTPGVLGVAVRRAGRVEVLGPESMLARNTDMTQSAMALANTLADDASAMLRPPGELVESGYVFYRFEPVVLVQPAQDMGPVFVDRGGRVIQESELSIRAIRELGANIAEHLGSRRWPGVERYGLGGTLDPVTGKNASPFASPFDQAMGAYALLGFASLGDGPEHARAAHAGKSVLIDLAIVEPKESPVWDEPVGSSMALIALSELQLVDILADQSLSTLRKRVIETVDGAYTQASGFDESIPTTAQGLIVHALVCAAKIDPRQRTELAKSALEQVLADTPITGLVAQMPFLGWAAIDLAGDASQVPAGDALLAMRALVWEHQLTKGDLSWMDRDLEGGIVFTSSSTPLPSWVSTKPMAILSTMLGDPRLTPGTISSGEIPVQIAHQIDGLRFIRQLCAQDEIMHLYAAGEHARWGVRKALWDQRLAVEVDAMALLTLSESIRSFDAIMDRINPETLEE